MNTAKQRSQVNRSSPRISANKKVNNGSKGANTPFKVKEKINNLKKQNERQITNLKNVVENIHGIIYDDKNKEFINEELENNYKALERNFQTLPVFGIDREKMKLVDRIDIRTKKFDLDKTRRKNENQKEKEKEKEKEKVKQKEKEKEKVKQKENNPYNQVTSKLMKNPYNEVDDKTKETIGAFSQFDRATLEQQGVGLGLITSINLIKFYNGKITCSLNKTKGTSVKVSLLLV